MIARTWKTMRWILEQKTRQRRQKEKERRSMLALQTLWIQTFLSAGLSTCINHNETAVTGQVSSDCTGHTDKREQSDIKITCFTQKHPETTVSRNTVYKKFNVPEKCNRNISHFSKSLMKWAWDILGGLVKYLMWDIRTGLELKWNFRHYKAVLLYALQCISFLCFILWNIEVNVEVSLNCTWARLELYSYKSDKHKL